MKSAFVTGGNQGLGYGFVQILLTQGYRVFGGTRQLSLDLPQHENLFWIEINLESDDSIEAAVRKVSEHTNSIDLLINNAGINKDTVASESKEKVGSLVSLDRHLLHKMFDINAIAPMLVLQKFLPMLANQDSFVINISSCRGSFHDELANKFANYGYRGSKIALNMFTFCSVLDLPKNIKIFAVHPGEVKTSMNPSGKNEPIVQAEKILSIKNKWNDEWNGKFMRYSGEEYPL